MDRRAFIGTLTSSLLAAPLAPEAQPADRVYRIGILGNVPISDPGSARLWGAFADGLRDLGYVDGRNIRIEYLYALEREAFGSLQGDVYVRGFLRSYSSYLGLNPDKVVSAYVHAMGGAVDDVPGPPPLAR